MASGSFFAGLGAAPSLSPADPRPGIEHQSQAFAGDWRDYLVVGFSSQFGISIEIASLAFP